MLAALFVAHTGASAQDAQRIPRSGAEQPPTPAVYTASLGDAYTASYGDDVFASSILDTETPYYDLPPTYRTVGYESPIESCDSCDGAHFGKCDSQLAGFTRHALLPGGLLSRSFGSLEYLQWYSKDRRFPALVTTSPVGTPALLAGRLDQATTTTLFGGNKIGGDRQSGGRLTLGLWLDDAQVQSLGVRFYGNEGEAERFSASSTGDPILARPYFDTNILVNGEAAFLVAYPGVSSGDINMSAKNDVLGGEVFTRWLYGTGCDYRIDLLAGYQFNRIDDDLVMSSVTTSGGVTTRMLDEFDVQNEFHAGELGLVGEFYRDCLTMTVMGKLAVGSMRQRAAINGQYSTTGIGARSGPGGLMAQPTNIGVYERDVTVWSPEVEVKLSYAVNDRLSLSIGYSAIYWSRVALAGDLVDRNLNSAQIVSGGLPFAPPNDPAFTWRDTEFWVQTVNLGGDFAY